MAEQEVEDEEEDLEHRQRLKAALHYAVGKVCKQVGEENELRFSRELVAAITETTFKQCHTLATDLELFAKHAKRSTVSPDDVKMCCRRSPSLLKHITQQADKLKIVREANKEKGGGGGGGGSDRTGRKKKARQAVEPEAVLINDSD